MDFIVFSLNLKEFQIFNYIDKPDLKLIQLIKMIKKLFNYNHNAFLKIPYFIAVVIIVNLEFLSKFIRINLPISYIRIKKFCSTTQFDSKYIGSTSFKAKFTLKDGLKNTIEFEFKKK